MLPTLKRYNGGVKTKLPKRKRRPTMLSDNIRNLRKANGWTQEELADKLNVSRQAITKWESGAGTPDIDNLNALAKLFGITLDELMADGVKIKKDTTSRTEFDAEKGDDFEINVGNAKTCDIGLIDGDKIIIEVFSDLETTVFPPAKVALKNGRRDNITDIKIKLVKGENALTEREAKEHLSVKILLPASCGGAEIAGSVKKLYVHDFAVEKHIEFDGKADQAEIKNMKGHLELTSDTDTEVFYDGSMEKLDINQWKCLSVLYLAKGTKVNVYNKGRACKLQFDGFENDDTAENKVEFNGYRSELTVKGD